MKKTQDLFRSYEYLVERADTAFQQMEKQFGPCVACVRGCSDCCHAVFGLFIMEAAHLKKHFDQLDKGTRERAWARCAETEKGLAKLESMLQEFQGDPRMQSYAMGKQRIRCSLLDENDDCILYEYRPITCRVYGIPTRVQGAARVCGKTGFKRGESYPLFDLDGVYGDLFILSRELLINLGRGDPEKASLLISVSKALKTPLEDLIDESFSARGKGASRADPGVS
jgi:Fe-S-cluster containining protein